MWTAIRGLPGVTISVVTPGSPFFIYKTLLFATIMYMNDVGDSIENKNIPTTGLFGAKEYILRRSNTLLQNFSATLNERSEIQKYLQNQDFQYLVNIKKIVKSTSHFKSSCRLSINIPAYGEGSRIGHTLKQYIGQDIGHELFEIIIFSNPMDSDDTVSEVEKFKTDHPEMSIEIISKSWDKNEPKTVGNARKYAADISILRILERDQFSKDHILIFNDADSTHIEKNYLSSILKEFDTNHFMDALVTKMTLPTEALEKPNVAAGFILIDTFERVLTEGKGDGISLDIPEPAFTSGRSSASRVSTYVAVGGFNPNAIISEDFELGWMIADARDWDPLRIIQFDITKITTDARRFIDAVANRVPIDQMLINFQTNPSIRQMDNVSVLNLITDCFDWELFQDEADSLWHSQFSGANKRIGENFPLFFKATMQKLGINYELIDGKYIKLTNINNFLKRISDKKEIEVIHSKERIYSLEMIDELHRFFSGLSNGIIQSRLAKAKKIVSIIDRIEPKDSKTLTYLMSQYKRFAGQSLIVNTHAKK